MFLESPCGRKSLISEESKSLLLKLRMEGVLEECFSSGEAVSKAAELKARHSS